MPFQPKKPCCALGCHTLTTARYCEKHVGKAQEKDRGRLSSTKRGYGYRWQKIRAAVLAEEPLCRFHHEKGEVVAATEVDHIDGNSRNNARSNLRPLCKPCHSARTARDQAFGRKRK